MPIHDAGQPVVPTLHPSGPSWRAALAWKFTNPTTVLSSAAVGGGLQQPAWLLNIGVLHPYTRTDLSEHTQEIATQVGLTGTGVGLLTAADVSQVCRSECDGVLVDATVGVTKPTWAADITGGYTSWAPGTINIVVQLPVALEQGAAVNAIMTVTEAKTQALVEYGVPGTGTASDAVAVLWPTSAQVERFAGPRSVWGSRIAQATHRAILAGIVRDA